MADHKKVSVERVIQVSKFTVLYPFIFIAFGSIVSGMIFLGVNEYSGWYLIPLCVGSATLSALFYYSALTKWRIWAFDNVSNIFELEQSKQSYPLLRIAEAEGLVLTKKDREKLEEIKQRLTDPSFFTDDENVPASRPIYSTKWRLNAKTDPVLILSNEGIESKGVGFAPWKDISDENVMYIWTGDAPYYQLRYLYQGNQVIVPIKRFDISPLGVQHLLYVYRGRYTIEFTIKKRPH